MQALDGFATLAARFDGFIIDLWGVIHDGVTPYPGAAQCLARLRDAGKPVVLLSNAPRRAVVAQAAMRAMGIEDALYTDILTSGEATHQALRERRDPWFAALGRRVYHLGPDRDRNVIEGLDLDRAERPEQAEFVLNTGPDDTAGPVELDEFRPLLDTCAVRGLPMICANPDLEVIRGGVRVMCAGTLAQYYAGVGGDVRWVGKPDPAIYVPVLLRLGVARDRVLAVGDALRTDIAGAAAAGVAACWVLGGLDGAELGYDSARAEQAAAAANLSPIAVIPAFRWE